LEPRAPIFEAALADGYHVLQANPADPRSWEALGMEKRAVVVIATGDVSISRELTPLVDERLPGVTRILAVPSAKELDEFDALGVVPVDMSASGGAERMIDAVFAALDQERRLPANRHVKEEDQALEFA